MILALVLATSAVVLLVAAYRQLVVANPGRLLPHFGRPEAPAVTPSSARWLNRLAIPASSFAAVLAIHLDQPAQAVIILGYLGLVVLLPCAVIGVHNRGVRRRVDAATLEGPS